MNKLRLLLVDDHPIVRAGVKACLAAHPELEVVGEAADGYEALRLARELAPDIVLMDIRMPGMSGVETTRRLLAELPAARVLALSMYANKHLALELREAGARGYVHKDSPPSELIQAIAAVHRGELHFHRGSRPAAGQDELPLYAKQALSERERQVLALLAWGLSSKGIAERLGVSVRTVQTHREHIMKKLDIHTATGLTRYALNEGIIPPE